MSSVGKLARQILDDRAKPRPAPRVGCCFLCGRSYSTQSLDGDSSTQFCSAKCRGAYDAGIALAVEPNPFVVDQWRVIAGPPPGRMPKAPRMMGRHGFYIDCLHCKREFESRGLRCCSAECGRALKSRADTAATMAEVGMVLIEKRKCESCGGDIPNWTGEGFKRHRTRKSQRYCSARCQRKANETGGILALSPSKTAFGPSEAIRPIFGPSTSPLNLVGGYRFAAAPDISFDRAEQEHAA
jgi:hypothetical protein